VEIMVSALGSRFSASRPVVLCAGIAVQDYIFRVDRFPTPGTKAAIIDLAVTGGGCAANAAITVARLGGEARFAGPLGRDPLSDKIIRDLVGAGIDVGGVEQVEGGTASVSGIFIDSAGERLLATKRENGLRVARPRDPDNLVRDADVVLADNHFPEFALPICRAARAHGRPVVLDLDRGTQADDPLLASATHAIFSAEALRATTKVHDVEEALVRSSAFCTGFVAATDGEKGAWWHQGSAVRHVDAFAIDAADTLAAGDVFHGAFALRLAEGAAAGECVRFACAAAALKCRTFGGILGAPNRAEVERLLNAESVAR
jgi:sulfofructose kinase